ncbi:PF10990 domain protein [Leptospira kirschneri str. H1]|uniref:PF10990 domain protein n=1 Tax=Leptospira kirschneri str. H1 TaxID=1049966 RepID=A0A0E2BA96_9LEPT|nr:PF10990 domain protein [Leptospira kirschneri str. H1]
MEILQYFKIVSLLGFQENYITKIVFGSVFDPLDLIAYFIGAVLILYLDKSILQKFYNPIREQKETKI